MKKVIGKKVVTEDFNDEVDDIGADGLSTSGRRRLQIERTLAEAKVALDEANEKNNAEAAAKMQDLIDGLQDLLDRNPSNSDEAQNHNDNKDKDEGTAEKSDEKNSNEKNKDSEAKSDDKEDEDDDKDANEADNKDDKGENGDEKSDEDNGNNEESNKESGESENDGGNGKEGGDDGKGGGGKDGKKDGELDFGDEEGSENSSNNDIENPFKLTPHDLEGGNPKGNLPNDNSAEEQNKSSKQKTPEQKHKEKIEVIKAMLKKLQRGEKAGAIDAIKKLLGENITSTKTESLKEDFDTYGKSVGELTVKEFDDIMDRAIDMINSVHHINITTKDSRVKEIKRDNTVLNNRDLEAEDNNNLRDERNARKAQKKEAQKYTAAKGQDLNVFKQHLWRCLKDQIADVDEPEDSWSAINKHHQNDGVLLPGEIIDTHKKPGEKPTLRVYMDCSGSFSKSDIEAEEAAIAILSEFEKRGKCAIELLYFSTNLHTDYRSAEREGGTAAWVQMVEDMQAKKPTNVVIMTDSDMEGLAQSNSQTYIAPGCVWYIWKRDTAPSMLDKVRGRRGTYEFSL